ncbi:peptidoglycan synthetase FtsI [Actinocorallia herbida]|uniref:Peptidoglycan synthetase FtsI n=1 Tax=Actinocorallia herbida TaxID=58109 RepID=A0A3N1CV93_9ACTN|nr:penicillin-binding protein 2 [Actinocorallia herbida]ROO85144.1 peptidoglycan synthetase FtsI [Actinocorallia herbida]
MRPPPRKGGGRSVPPGRRGPSPGGPRARRPPPLPLAHPAKRLNAGLLIAAFLLSLCAGRLVRIQGIDAAEYTELARAQREYRIDLVAERGTITDVNGARLAMSQDAFGVFADPTLIEEADREKVAAQLAGTLGMKPAEILAGLGRPDTRYVELAHRVRPERAKLITALGHRGIGTFPEPRRVYPADSVAAQLVGFVKADGEGGAGLEFQYNELLKGTDGWQNLELDGDGRRIPLGDGHSRQPVAGRGLRLTIDQDIQWKAEELIAQAVEEHDAAWGTALVLTPDQRILAMASTPSFDPNAYQEAPESATRNLAVQEPFEPGSTGKIVTAAALLEEGLVTPEQAFTVPYSVRRAGREFHDAKFHETQRLTFAGILATSSNVGTILAGEPLAKEDLHRYLRAFGFAEPTGVNLPGETPGLLARPADWSGADRYPISYGQAVSVSSLQMASVYATIANGGVRTTPSVVAGTYDERGRFVPAAAPSSRRVVSPDTARRLSVMMEAVVNRGTARGARLDGYRVAGKTGTANRYDPAKQNAHGTTGGYDGYTGMFAGFAPADAPKAVVQIVLQDPRKGYYGGEVAAPVFRALLDFSLRTLKVPPTGTTAPDVPLTADEQR